MTNNSYFNFIRDLSDEQVEKALNELRKEFETRKKAHPHHYEAEAAKPTAKATDSTTAATNTTAKPETDEEFENQVKSVFVDAIKQLAMAKKVTVKGCIDAKKSTNTWENGRSVKGHIGFDIAIEIG